MPFSVQPSAAQSSTFGLRSGSLLLLVSFEHVVPERLYFLNVASLAVDGDARECEAFGELAFQADLLVKGARNFTRLVIA